MFIHTGIEGINTFSKKAATFPVEFQKELLSYEKAHVHTLKGPMRERGCHYTVARLNKFLKAKYGDAYGYKSIMTTFRGPRPRFFEELGFDVHAMSLVSSKEDRPFFAALDLHAYLYMDQELGTMDIFAILGDSQQEIFDVLREITRQEWEEYTGPQM